jgi:hypothetical protein
MPSMKSALSAGLIVAILLAAYSGGYLATVQPTPVVATATAGILIFETEDHYRGCDPIARWVFWPANQLDRKIWPETWALKDNL